MGGMQLVATGFAGASEGVRTYVGSFTNSAPTSAVAIESLPAGAARKAAAYAASASVTGSAMADAAPQLEALRERGLITGYRTYAATGMIAIDVPESQAAAGWDAINQVAHTGKFVRSREFTLAGAVDAVAGAALAAPTSAFAPPAVVPRVATRSVGAVRAEDVWRTNHTGAGVVVGILDTGVDGTHSFLASSYRGARAGGSPVQDYNWYDAFGLAARPVDDHSHGTHVTGIVVGRGTMLDQGASVPLTTGVAPGAKWIAARMMSSKMSATTEQTLAAVNWMLAPTDAQGRNADPTKAPDIVNSSWSFTDEDPRPYQLAFDAMRRAGIVSIVAAGNAGPGARTIGDLGSFPSNITVAATDGAGSAADFSSRGPGRQDLPGLGISKPDIAAPGVAVFSSTPGNALGTKSGTSMAAPVAAGIAALVLGKYPTLTPAQVRLVLERSGADLGPAGRDSTYGAGRIDAVRAMAAADALVGARSRSVASVA
ncbi:MAG: serine protease [Thermoleophilia bacterium]|nr:serine protease [Thermoleophilia bacterium]